MRARAGGTSDTDSLDDEDQKPSRPRAAKVNRGLVVLVFILSGVVLLLLLGPSHEIHHSVPAVPPCAAPVRCPRRCTLLTGRARRPS